MKSVFLILLVTIMTQELSAAILKVAEPVKHSNYQVIKNATVGPGPKDGVVKNRATRSNLIVGYPVAGDRLLARQYLHRYPIANSIQTEDLVYRSTNATTRITSVQALEVGYTQYAGAWIVQGGLGWANVTVRVQSYRSYGYYYQVDIWGR